MAFGLAEVLLCWAGQKVPVRAAERGISSWSAHGKVQLTEQIPQSGCDCVQQQWPQHNKLNSESLNYAAHEVHSVSFPVFFVEYSYYFCQKSCHDNTERIASVTVMLAYAL